MKKLNSIIKNSIINALVLAISFALCLVMHKANISELITTLFVFSVFVISILTEGYIYGIIAAIISCIAVNYAFTFPFFEFSLSLPANIISAVVMIVISMLTSALITRVRRHDIIRAESENERMRANLLRSVSHDLRTPLTTIYGSSSALLENRDTLTEEQQQKMLESICQDSQWLVRIVENLLSVTRIDSGSVNLIKTPTVLEELVDSVIVGFKKRYPNQKVEIDIPDALIIKARNGHVKRLKSGECTIESGFIWADLITDLERTADHCSNIAVGVIDAANNNMNGHKALRAMKKGDPFFEERYAFYVDKYM